MLKNKKCMLLCVSAILLFLLIFCSCDAGNKITKIELGSFPDNIVYYVNESNELDLSGGTMLVSLQSGVVNEYPIRDCSH